MYPTVTSAVVLAAITLAGPATADHLIRLERPPDVAALKTVYLACERRAQTTRIDEREYQLCATIYEELKQHGFAGSFRALHAWYVAARRTLPPRQPSDDRPVTLRTLLEVYRVKA
ncbi:hypothetical protein HMH01_03880 [Halovulum dunhuangense]|uniref:Uncharacterized protein n=1 Tax=Halovulum dunhuangense TaxID=1505036 RepID=A0A849KZF9_9RHOB|nr:hypothetical protein [Halovulum dunhuangense]NNU79572.1 hypothetical protein [Halovulum dunhuangense]